MKGRVGLSILQVAVQEMVIHLSFGGGVQIFPLTVGTQYSSGTVVMLVSHHSNIDKLHESSKL